MKKLLSIFLGVLVVTVPAVMAQNRNTRTKQDDRPTTRAFTESVQLTMRFPSTEVVELIEWQVTLATPAANTVTVTVARGNVTNQYQDLLLSEGNGAFQTVSWTDPVGVSLVTGDTITWSNTAAGAAQLTYKFRHPGE